MLTANAMVNWLVAQDAVDPVAPNQLTDPILLQQIECFLSAHFYTHKDKQYQQKMTGRASAAFQGQTAMNLSSSDYGQTAMFLDVTGRLAERSVDAQTGLRRVAGAQHLGSDDCD